jgi:cysteine desulfurase family protein (TIGR01976 family)
MSSQLDTEFLRPMFPPLKGGGVFVENAGGTYVPDQVILRLGEYMQDSQVQPNWNFASSIRATERIREGRRLMAEMINAETDEIVIGPSTTLNIYLLSQAIRPWFKTGDEIIVTEQDHEANIGAWRRLEETGLVIKEWKIDRQTGALDIPALDGLIGPRTRLVAFTHCSNVIGIVHDVPQLAARIRQAGALSFVDGTAFAPHFPVDVKELGADFYVFSLYKVYGPHQSVLFGRRDLLLKASSRNHFFIPPEKTEYTLLPGGPNHELSASLVGLAEYFETLDRHHFPQPANSFHARIKRVFGLIAAHEGKMAARIRAHLAAKPGIKLVGGVPTSDGRLAPVIAFHAPGKASSLIVAELNARDIAIGHGDFWANRCIRALGLTPEEGLVRIGLAHYNDDADVKKLLAALDAVLD